MSEGSGLQSIRKHLQMLIMQGVSGEFSSAEQRRVRVTNLAALIGFGISLSYTPQFMLVSWHFWSATLVNVVAMALYAKVIWANRIGQTSLAAGLMILTANAEVLASSLLLGRGAGIQYFYFVLPAVTELIVPLHFGRRRWLVAFACFPAFVIAQYWLEDRQGLLHVSITWQAILHPVSALSTFVATMVIVQYFRAETIAAEAKADAEYERSEALLLNILPAETSNRLKRGDKNIADGIDECSVLFADIVGFTQLSSRMRPGELVEMLNSIFIVFDDLSLKFGLEKIKTIGDAYMVCSGLPQKRADHAPAMAAMALAMRDAMPHLGNDLAVRIGVHSGPVVAGVIGKRKFSYDVWGDTVNTASRMESHGESGRVQVSQAFVDCLGDDFIVEKRGVVDIKGKGPMTTYWLQAAKMPDETALA